MNRSKTLQLLFTDHWEAWLGWDPLFASQCGDRRYNDRLPAAGEEHYTSWRRQLLDFRRRLEKTKREALGPEDRLDREVFARLLDNEIAELGFPYYRVALNRSGSFQAYLPGLHMQVPLSSLQDYENYLDRLEAVSRYFEESIGLMRLGLESGFRPPRCTLEGVQESLRPHLVDDPQGSAFYQAFTSLSPAISGEQAERLRCRARKVIRGSIVPAYRGLLQFLEQEYLPGARQSIAAGDLPEGEAFYCHRIRYFTTLDLTPESVHATGREEVGRIREQMLSAIRSTGFAGDFQAFLAFLRSEPRFYTTTPEALMEKAALVCKRMDGELPRLFRTLPRLPYGIRAIPAFNAAGNTTAYYQPGAGDGSLAGCYYVNTHDLPSRPLYELEALTLHEAVPGHHLQIALQQELDGLPEFRRFYGFTSFVEGWALYAERLGLEVGFYQDPYSNFGRLSYEMWRACRLVVDTGIHALGWTRQQAIDFMAENTSSTLLNIANEVDRYIAWPGQALAYKLGELKIRQLRAAAEQELGEGFDLRAFHDVLLLAGALPLDVLETRVRAWISAWA